MTGSVALDVVIGLVFIYLLYSLLVSIIQESIATIFGFRAKFLEKAIIRMLEDGNASPEENFFESFLGIFKVFGKRDLSKLHLTKAFYKHPLIKYLAEDCYHSKPSYLNAQNFSKTLLDLLRGNDFSAGEDPRPFIEKALKEARIQWKNKAGEDTVTINEETLNYLKSLWADAQGDVNKFRIMVEGWFDEMMTRTTGWYKRHAQGILFMLGLLLAISFNVDTIKIADRLSKDPDLREQLVKQAGAYVEAHKAELEKLEAQKADTSKKVDSSLVQVKKKADELWNKADSLVNKDIANVNKTLGLGWSCRCSKKDGKPCSKICMSQFSGSSIIGWILTAFALSLGAPFWFDLLNKLMKLRGSVNSGEKDAQDAKTGQQRKDNPKG